MRKQPLRIKQNDEQILQRPTAFVSFLSQENTMTLTGASTGEPRLRGTLLQDSLKHIPVSLDTRHPASYGPEVRYRTPSALSVNHKAMASKRNSTLMSEAGAACVRIAQHPFRRTYVLPERLRVAHPCAQSRSTVHPEHNTLGSERKSKVNGF